MTQLTKNLKIQSIEANNWKHDDQDREITICWALHFEFFNTPGFSVFIADDAILREHPSFQLVESDEAELHDSFMYAIENSWDLIVNAVKKWEAENFKEQTDLVNKIENNRIESGLV